VSTENSVNAAVTAQEMGPITPAPVEAVTKIEEAVQSPADSVADVSAAVNSGIANNPVVNVPATSINGDGSSVNTVSDALAATNPGQLSIDGSPVAEMAGAIDTPVDFITKLQDFLTVGGPVVWILMGFSVIALCIVLVKMWQFAMLRPESTGDVRKSLSAWRRGENQEAIAALKTRRPVSEVTAMAMHGLSRQSADLTLLKEELERVATNRMNQLRAFLRPLEVIATLSPLLGLLGTVLGMIVAFQQMEAAGSQVDPSVLSGGIWQALLTTAVGLIVAIPVVAIHTWLERKVERISALMNDSVTQVFTSHQSISLSQAKAEEIKRAA